jgi:hypothetical protein
MEKDNQENKFYSLAEELCFYTLNQIKIIQKLNQNKKSLYSFPLESQNTLALASLLWT